MKKILKWLLIVAIIIGGVILAHNKVHVICDNMCLEEGMTKEEIMNLVSVKKEIVFINMNFKLYNNSGSQMRYQEVNDVPVTFCKNGNMVTANLQYEIVVQSDSKNAEVKDGMLTIYVTSTEMSNVQRIVVSSYDTDIITKISRYAPIKIGGYTNPIKEIMDYENLTFNISKENITSTLKPVESGKMINQVTYMADNTD